MKFCGRFYLAFGVVVALASLDACAALAADPADAGLVEHGRYLATAGDCVACHTTADGQPLAGGLPLQTPFGAIISTNITPSKTYGIGNYSLASSPTRCAKACGPTGRVYIRRCRIPHMRKYRTMM